MIVPLYHMPPKVAAAMQFIGFCQTATNPASMAGENWKAEARELTTEEEATRTEALTLLRRFFKSPGFYEFADVPPPPQQPPAGPTQQPVPNPS